MPRLGKRTRVWGRASAVPCDAAGERHVPSVRPLGKCEPQFRAWRKRFVAWATRSRTLADRRPRQANCGSRHARQTDARIPDNASCPLVCVAAARGRFRLAAPGDARASRAVANPPLPCFSSQHFCAFRCERAPLAGLRIRPFAVEHPDPHPCVTPAGAGVLVNGSLTSEV